jgi:integrase
VAGERAALIDGLHIVRIAKAGKPVRWYVYAWRGGPCIARRQGDQRPRLTAQEIAEYQRVKDEAHKPPAGILRALIREWTGGREWTALEQSTRTTWQRHLDLIEARWGETPLQFWGDSRMVQPIIKWRDSRADTPRSADIGVTVLKALLEYGRLRGRVAVNIAAGIPAIAQAADRAHIIWTDDDIARIAKHAPQRIMDGLRLCAVTGLRRADLLDLRWSEIGEHAIVRMARKKSRGRRQRATVPIIPQARTLLADLRTRMRGDGVDHVLVDSRGMPWKPTSFSAQFNAARDAAGIIHPGDERIEEPDRKKHLHDVRGTFVTHLCRARLTDEEIAGIMAWTPASVSTIRKTYVDDAAIVVALAERINRAVKRPVKQPG